MDFWLVLFGFICAMNFLFKYYHWLNDNKDLTPFHLVRILGMLLAIFLCINDRTNSPVLSIIIGVILFLFIIFLNISYAGIKHGLLISLWQFLVCAIVLVVWVVIDNDKNVRIKKE